MKIEFVNHASFLTDCGPVRLLCDPWFEGTAFNDGWALLSPTAFQPTDWERVTHLWFSHEHPDHFSPAALRAIPAEVRAGITVLYQQTADGKVAGFCRKLGFREVRELAPGGWTPLADGVAVWCEPWTSGDSWLALRSGDTTLLNLNDCAITTAEETASIGAKVGPVDVLATQFSISAWDGNPEEEARLRAGAAAMLERMAVHARTLNPRWTLPFASFVWFCHEENVYLNDFHNRVEAAVDRLCTETPSAPLVLYPGETWTVGDPHDPGPAIRRYAADYDSIPSRPLHRAAPVPEAQLVELARKWCATVREGSDALRLRVRLARQAFRGRRAAGTLATLAGAASLLTLAAPEAWIWVADYQAAYALSLFGGLRRVRRSREQCQVSLSSDSLRYAFQFLWGGETLLVNGRFRELHPEGRGPLFQYFGMAGGRNRGEAIGWRELIRRRLLRRAA